jgi:hypothetical protein
MKQLCTGLLATLAAVLLVGCMSEKAPAEQALASAESALVQIRDMAQKYAPDQLQAVDSQLSSLKDALAKGDYKAVLAGAPALNTAISNLKDAASAKQQEAEEALAKAKDAWGPISTEVPKMVDAIQSRVDILSKSHHLPKGVTKDSLAAAKSSLDSMKSAWSDASTAATGGDYSTAMTKAQAVKDQAGQVMKSLGMTSG